ncbi:serine hydrolase [Nonomuraea sp. NPDC047529]|uniref:serine hydrolase n=1 Tax=Nonomuraea sp. NPDC047529 TaxID=3155623 RepID=UPI0033CAA0A0
MSHHKFAVPATAGVRSHHRFPVPATAGVRSHRRFPVLATAVMAAAVTACAAQPVPALATVTAATTSTPAARAAAEIPDTPAGRQLTWLLDAVNRLPVGDAELAGHFAPSFLERIPPAQVNQALAGFGGMRLDRLDQAQERSLSATVTAAGKAFTLALSVDGTDRIDYIQFSGVAPASWSELDQRLRQVAPRAGFLAAELTGDGRCRPVHAVAGAKTFPLGSMFKLYVLGAVAERIRSGAFGWDTRLTIRPELKSLPSGELQDRPDNSQVTVLEAARLMISISDNTAADLLIDKAGRRTVERVMRSWGGDRRNVPFLTTRELFVLKGADHPRYAERYLSLGTSARRDYLARVVDKVPVSKVRAWSEPRELDRLEWFATPAQVCRAYGELARLKDARVGEVLSITDAGLRLDKAQWPVVWHKGGSEPGLVAMSFLARTAGGRTYVVSTTAVNPSAPLQQGPVAQELLTLTRGAFTLVTSS